MALPLSGIIKASMIREELKETGTWRAGSDSSRKLAKVPNGTIKFSDFYGKSMESPMDFWIEGRMTLYYDPDPSIVGWPNYSVGLNITKYPNFLKQNDIEFMAIMEIISKPYWTNEWVTMTGSELLQFKVLTRELYYSNGVKIPESDEKPFVGSVEVNPDTGISYLSFVAYDHPTPSIFNPFGYIGYENFKDRDYIDVKIHIKLSNSLYYKLLGFVSSCLSSLFGGEHYGIA